MSIDRPSSFWEAQQTRISPACQGNSEALQVLELRDILRYDVEASVTERMGLEEFALHCLTYKLAEGFSEEDIDEKYRFYVTEDYKVLNLIPFLQQLRAHGSY